MKIDVDKALDNVKGKGDLNMMLTAIAALWLNSCGDVPMETTGTITRDELAERANGLLKINQYLQNELERTQTYLSGEVDYSSRLRKRYDRLQDDWATLGAALAIVSIAAPVLMGAVLVMIEFTAQ